jgi:hypothetical protein
MARSMSAEAGALGRAAPAGISAGGGRTPLILSWRATLTVRSATVRRMPACRLVDRGKPAQRVDHVAAITVAEVARHGDRPRELLELLGGRVVGHQVDHDAGCRCHGVSAVWDTTPTRSTESAIAPLSGLRRCRAADQTIDGLEPATFR